MPTPLPAPGTENLELPGLDEINFVALGIRSGCIDGPRLTDLQLTVLDAVTESMTGVKVDLDVFEPLTAQQFAEGLASRNEIVVQPPEVG